MSESLSLCIQSKSLGRIYLDPGLDPIDQSAFDAHRESVYAIFPRKLSERELHIAIEWTALPTVQIYTHRADAHAMAAEGFPIYRFNRLEGYREMRLSQGVLEFFPARRRRRQGLFGIFEWAMDFAGLLSAKDHHVLIRPQGEGSVLYLATPNIDATEWSILSRAKPGIVLGSTCVPAQEWQVLAMRIGRNILSSPQQPLIKSPQKNSDGTIEHSLT